MRVALGDEAIVEQEIVVRELLAVAEGHLLAELDVPPRHELEGPTQVALNLAVGVVEACVVADVDERTEYTLAAAHEEGA